VTPRPRWRWWLFCVALSLFWRLHRHGVEWPGELMSWCLPLWSSENLARFLKGFRPDVNCELPGMPQ
jgi:hypothetical protein